MKALRVIPTVMMCILCTFAFTQPTVLGTQTVNGSYATYNLTDHGLFRQVRIQATSSGATGTRNWLFAGGTAPGAVDYTVKWCPYTGGLTLAGYNTTIQPVGGTASALYNYSPGGADGLMPAVTNGNYYTFNTTEYSVAGTPANEYMGVMETSFNPVAITSVTQSPGAAAVYPENSVYVTVTTAAPPSAGEYVYVRYSTVFNFTSSTLLPVTITGTTGTVEIPCQLAGTTIYYYAYTSNRTSAQILADVGTYGQMSHDMSTLSINNNGGPNYSYTVLTSVGFCGNYYVPSACYPTIASFVTALNAGTVFCPVICNVAAGHTETAPAGGINLTQTGTAINTITFMKSGTGANPIIYAQTGTVTMTGASTTVDGIFSLNGSDYVTIDGIDLTDNNASAPGTMEYGYALFKNSNTDGCQHNTIKNCAITLKASNVSTGPSQFEDGSKGIFSGNITRTALTSTLVISTTTGRNDNNVYASNTIKNVHHGIVIRGYYDLVSPYTYYDQNNEIGQAGAGNTIENYGSGGSSAVFGIYVIYQNNHVISNNSINNTASGGSASTSILYGIFNGSNTTTSVANLAITNNTISLTQGSATSAMYGIKSGSSSGHLATTVSITSNTIQNCSFSVSSSGTFRGIDQLFVASTITISDNIIQNNTLNSTASVGINDLLLINNNTATPNTTITNNQLLNNSKTGSGSASLYGYYNNGVAASGTETVTGNIIYNLSVPSGSPSSAIGIRITTAPAQNKIVNSNTVSHITGGTGTSVFTSGIIIDGMNSSSSANNNVIQTVTGGANVSGLQCTGFNATSLNVSSNANVVVSGNSISDISTSGTGATGSLSGLAIHASTLISALSNTIDSIIATGASPLLIRAISAGGCTSPNTLLIDNSSITNVYHNNAGGTAVVSGIYLFPTSSTVTVSANDLANFSGGAASDMIIGIYATSGSVTYAIYNNILQRFTAPSSTQNLALNGIYTSAVGSTYNVSNNTIAFGENSIVSGGSGFGVCGMYHGAGILALRNNIIYINATAVGNGVASCVRKGTAGVAATAPATTSITSSTNNNYYFINTASSNYIYVEGASTSTIKNGYAWSGATTNVTNNLNNDPCFNILTASDITSYKYFMSLSGGGTREINSYYDVPPFAGGPILPDNLKLTTGATTYAESGAVVIAGITTDYEGDARSGSTPDIGADEGDFVVQTPDCYLLPLELIAFTGWYNGSENELHWTTATEINSDYFGVEKSINGIDFYTIGNVNAAGNSLVESDYTFYDDDPVAGINYYRLRMTDIDGAFEYSNTIAIRVDEDGTPAFIVYPNPVSANLNFSVNSSFDQQIVVEITDIPGKKLLSRKFVLHSGQNTFTIDISSFAAAPYFIYYVNDAGAIQVTRFMKE